MKLSVKSLVIAAALLKALCFLFVSLLNLILPPYGGAFLALLSSLYLGYDPTAGPISVLVGTLYSLFAGAVAGGLFGWLYIIIVSLKDSEASPESWANVTRIAPQTIVGGCERVRLA